MWCLRLARKTEGRRTLVHPPHWYSASCTSCKGLKSVLPRLTGTPYLLLVCGCSLAPQPNSCSQLATAQRSRQEMDLTPRDSHHGRWTKAFTSGDGLCTQVLREYLVLIGPATTIRLSSEARHSVGVDSPRVSMHCNSYYMYR